MMPKEDYIEEASQDETKSGKGPDDQREKHSEENCSLLIVGVSQYPNVDEKLSDWRFSAACGVLPFRNKIGLHHRVKCNGVYDLTGTFCKQNT
jgi:hypothetical protein